MFLFPSVGKGARSSFRSAMERARLFSDARAKENDYGSQGIRRVLSGSATAPVLPDYPTRPL